MSNEIPLDLESLLQQPEHWQRAEQLIIGVQEIKNTYPLCRITSENATKAALESYPQLIQNLSKSENEEVTEIARMQDSMKELDELSATQTAVRITVVANSTTSHNNIKRDLEILANEHAAEQSGPKTEIIPKGLPEYSDQPVGIDTDHLQTYFEIYYVCKEK